MRYIALVVGTAILTGRLWAQAQLQLIHTVVDVVGVSSPNVLDSVDIYLSSDGGNTWTLFADNMRFRGATPYLPVPAGVPLVVGIAPGNASGPSPILYTASITSLANGSHNIGFLTGRLVPTPSLEVTLFPNSRATAQNPAFFEFTTFHAVSDAGGAAVYLFSAYSPEYVLFYRSTPPNYSAINSPLVLVIGDGANFNTTFIGYLIPDPSAIGALGKTGIIFLSGLVGTNDPNIYLAFHVVLSDGRVFPMPLQEVRRIQYIHNAADPQLRQIDLHPLTFPSASRIPLDFRAASPVYFLVGSTGTPIRFYIAQRGNTTSVLDSIDLIVPPPSNSAAIVQGVLNPSLYAPNPYGIPTAVRFFTLSGSIVYAPAGHLALSAFQGVTDALDVSIGIQNAGTFFNLRYGDYTTPSLVATGTDREIELRQVSNYQLIARFRLRANQIIDSSGAILMVSGFANPALNQNGPALGLYLVYPLGQVEPLTLMTSLSQSGPDRIVQVDPLMNDSGQWTVSLQAGGAGTLPYRLRDALGRSLIEGVWEIPSAGSWVYALPGETLPAGLYLLQVSETTFRLIR